MKRPWETYLCAEISGRIPSPAWLLTHAPFNAVKLDKNNGGDQIVNTINTIGEIPSHDREAVAAFKIGWT